MVVVTSSHRDRAFCQTLRWFERLARHARELLTAGMPVVLAGDFNVMPTDLDVYKPERSLLGAGPDLGAGADALLAGVKPNLLNAAVHVYAGEPQPLWWIGTHHCARAVWEPVMERIATTPDHPLFELAWDHIAFNGDGRRVARFVTELGPAHAERIFGILLRIKVGCTGNYMPEAWAALLGLASDEETHAHWLDRMVEAAPTILDDLPDLKFWLTQDRDLRPMLDRLKRDWIPVEMTRVAFDPLEGVDATEIQSKALKVLEYLTEERPPILFGTCDWLLNKLEP